MAVVFTDLGVNSKLKDKRKLKKFVAFKLEKEGFETQTIQYIFCSNTYLLDINQRFLNHDAYTDIITFDLSDVSREINAEIYISVEMVRENAETYNVSYGHELHRVIFHGILHLIGYHDKSQEEQETMRSMEDTWITEYENYKNNAR